MHHEWKKKLQKDIYISSMIEAHFYQVKIKVVKLEFLKGIVESRSNPFRGQVSAPSRYKNSPRRVSLRC